MDDLGGPINSLGEFAQLILTNCQGFVFAQHSARNRRKFIKSHKMHELNTKA